MGDVVMSRDVEFRQINRTELGGGWTTDPIYQTLPLSVMSGYKVVSFVANIAADPDMADEQDVVKGGRQCGSDVNTATK